jgi:DNA-binding CsgD family transcriptional regulator
MGEVSGDPLQQGRQALAAAEWSVARERFQRCLDEGGGTEALAGLAEALRWLGEYDRAIELKASAYDHYRRAGESEHAAEIARSLAFLHGGVYGNLAAANGWFAQAESALAELDESIQHGWLAFDRAPLTEDPAARERLAVGALAIARRFGDSDLEFDAMSLLGDAYVQAGRVAEGMTLIDQAMTAVTAGHVRGIVAMGDIYCRLLSSCERTTDVRRAEEWMGVINRFAAWSHSLLVSTTCRLHYGGILVAIGRWQEAEAELLEAIRISERSYRMMRTFPIVRLADLRLRQGRFEEAERLLEGCEWHPTARRCLAAAAFGRGELDLAHDLATLCVDAVAVGDPGRAPVLGLLIDIDLARGDLTAADDLCAKLEALAATGAPLAVAWCSLARGRAGVAQGRPEARSQLQSAVEGFTVLNLPLEAARARFSLAVAIATDTPAAAATEARLSLNDCHRLGARRDADAAAALLRRLGKPGRAKPRTTGVLSRREIEVLGLLGDGLANAQIAERLTISPRTAEHHVASILTKLALRSRSEAAAYAVREGIENPARIR